MIGQCSGVGVQRLIVKILRDKKLKNTNNPNGTL
jgi:hypothetical protein